METSHTSNRVGNRTERGLYLLLQHLRTESGLIHTERSRFHAWLVARRDGVRIVREAAHDCGVCGSESGRVFAEEGSR